MNWRRITSRPPQINPYLPSQSLFCFRFPRSSRFAGLIVPTASPHSLWVPPNPSDSNIGRYFSTYRFESNNALFSRVLLSGLKYVLCFVMPNLASSLCLVFFNFTHTHTHTNCCQHNCNAFILSLPTGSSCVYPHFRSFFFASLHILSWPLFILRSIFSRAPAFRS